MDMGGYYNLYPNLYVVLVSDSGVGMKSTAMDLGVRLLDEAKIGADILRGKITPARLVQRLEMSAKKDAKMLKDYGLLEEGGHGRSELFVYAREFRVFLKGVIIDSTLVEDLTDLYDCGKFEYDIKQEEKIGRASCRERVSSPV